MKTKHRREFKITDKEGNIKVVEDTKLENIKDDSFNIEEVQATDTIVNIEGQCNQECIFCSRGGFRKKSSEPEIKELILSQKNTISLEGGEPTLNKDLLKWIRFAKENGTREIILVTNGVLLFYKKFAKELVDAGVTLFNINFPSHIESLSDQITQTPGFFKRRVEGIRNLISLGAGNKTRLTFVINSLNYKTMPDFVKFVKKEFPEIFYIEFNLIKVLGYVKERKYLIPSLKDIQPYLHEAMEYSSKNNIKILVDGIPLCCMEGFEQNSIDVIKLMQNNFTFLCEKAKSSECDPCSLNKICAGPREDYLEVHGASELKTLSKNPDEILEKLKKK